MNRTILAAVVLVSLAACGGTDEPAAAPADDTDTTPTTASPTTAAPATTATPTTVTPTTVTPTTATPTTATPTTVTPTTATPGGEGLGDDEQAATDAWSLVFDSTVGFDDKAPHLADAEALRGTVESYTTAGAAMGGITLEPTNVVVDGDTATVTYDVLFGDTAAYGGLDGEITRVDGVWTVSREEFCAFMSSARNSCPSS